MFSLSGAIAAAQRRISSKTWKCSKATQKRSFIVPILPISRHTLQLFIVIGVLLVALAAPVSAAETDASGLITVSALQCTPCNGCVSTNYFISSFIPNRRAAGHPRHRTFNQSRWQQGDLCDNKDSKRTWTYGGSSADDGMAAMHGRWLDLLIL
jgi:hypothetical protein